MEAKFTKADLATGGSVKWCPGCGSFSILSAVHHILPETGVALENIVIVSGIGCSSRFPWYVNTYGFHGIHGRATAVATGVKLANPDLSVWVITGDGDALAIGGNHFIHLLRRNLNINIILFNNRIYGLTKGQFSPTTPDGFVTKTSPEGVIGQTLNAGELAIASGATFFARVVDTDVKMLREVLLKAEAHKGTALVEVLQNCVIFADQIHHEIADKETRASNTITLIEDEPIVFGDNNQHGLCFNNGKIEVIDLFDENNSSKTLLKHNSKELDKGLHFILAGLTRPKMPLVLGVVRDVELPVYEDVVEKQHQYAKDKSQAKSIKDLMQTGNVINL